MKFDKFFLANEIKDNLNDLGFFRTTDIQYKAIPPILNGEDVLAIAQTGSGKTAAFAIPIIHNIHQHKTSKRSDGIQCLILVPTRELSQQIGEVVAQLSRRTKVKSFAIYGGVEQDFQIQQIEGGVDILIATPGRMFDLIRQQVIDISYVRTLVLDEADRMLDLGFIDDIQQVKRSLIKRHQTLFFSATINTKIKRLAYSQIQSNAMRIQISPESFISKNITHSLVQVEMDEKRHVLTHFIEEHKEAKIILFVRTQVRAVRVLNYLMKNKIVSSVIHGGMDQKERENNLEDFKSGKTRILIATDVTARGIDISGISHVINYDLPDDPENYVHRIGRTGRGFNKGLAVSFCSTEEQEKLKMIEEFLNIKIPVQKVNEQYFEELTKPIDEMSISEMLHYEESLFVSSKRKPKKSDKYKK